MIGLGARPPPTGESPVQKWPRETAKNDGSSAQRLHLHQRKIVTPLVIIRIWYEIRIVVRQAIRHPHTVWRSDISYRGYGVMMEEADVGKRATYRASEEAEGQAPR